jgi:hypothetical protein
MQTKYCQYCGDQLTSGHASFGICAWCIKEIDDSQKKAKEYMQPGYFNGDRDDFKEEVDLG